MPEYIQPNNFEIESGAGSAQPEAGRAMNNFSEKVSFIWSVADLLRGDYKQSEYGRVILPLLVLRRLDQVLAPSREAVLAAAANLSRYVTDFFKNAREHKRRSFGFDQEAPGSPFTPTPAM